MAAYIKVPHTLYPDKTITVALYRNVSCKELRKSVMSGAIEVSLLKTSMVIDEFQVLVAANKALHLQHAGTMMTKNVHSEILFCLSPSKNISESFQSFGAADSDTNVVVAIADDQDDERLDKVSEILGKSPVALTELSELADTKLITKAYKVSADELNSYDLRDAVVSRISAKEIITAGKGKV
ncbi:EKC/KEOPS complex subunit TPRKB [Aplysia californica]|uniref:EKC/KEOPS complex subunit TPRKB n=1 Tax=Aplysia californica TaxID=6500 RepID=A0ABM1A485_APLCA|nr:EKC/KEOPS complex subunit TPRKB [Aplysia californica]